MVAQFARDLRLLREKAGTPTYRALGARAHYSAAALSEAAGGRKLPSLPVALAYVAACGGETAEWEDRWRTAAAELAAAKANAAGQRDRDGAPYVGLAAFQQEDAGRFFGRDEVVTELTTRLRQRRFLGVFGSSGCGKSSVLRAGLIARLSERQGPPIALFTPGQRPMEECAVQLAGFLRESPSALREEFITEPRNLHLRIRQAMTGLSSDLDVVLVVDQFEELFTLCDDEWERAGFVDALVTAATDPASRTRVVLGIRADFLGHCGQHPRLVTALRDGQVLVGSMTTDELRLAITGPAERAGYRVETALVARLVADATRQPGVLPLISHALLQTWLRRQGAVMTVAGYDAAGGIEHALARSAEDVCQSLDDDQRTVAKQIFLRLTVLGEGTEHTKRRVARHEFADDDPNTALVLDTLTKARLVTLGHDTVEIAHEALTRHWPRLRDWLSEDGEGHRLRRRLAEAAAEWARHDRDEGLLYRGTRLAVWQDDAPDRLNDTERAFLTASRHAERTALRRARLTIGGLGMAVAVVVVLAMVALVMAGEAAHERTLAVARQLVADARAQLQVDPELGLLLAREAYARARITDTEAVLRQATADSHLRATLTGAARPAMTGVAFSPDGRSLVTTDALRQLQMWAWDGEWVARRGPRVLCSFGSLGSPVFSPDGRRVVTACAEGVVSVWAGSGQRTPGTAREEQVRSVAFSPDGRRLARGGDDGTVKVADVAAGDRAALLYGHVGPVRGVAFSPDGRRLVSGGDDGTIRVWELASGRLVTVRTHPGPVAAVAFSRDGQHIVSAGADGGVRVWDATGTSEPVALGYHDGGARSVTYSPDGHSIASAGADGTVRIWNADQHADPVVLRGHRGVVVAVAFSPDGMTVASASLDGTAKVWAIDEVEDVTVLRGHRGSVSSVAASPDGRRLVSGGADGAVRLWDMDGDRPPLVLPGPRKPVTQVAFSPDGHHVAAVDEDDTVLVWNLRDLAEPALLHTYGGPVARMAFSPDGKRIAVASFHDVLWIWDTPERGETDQRTAKRLPGGHHALHLVAWSPDGHHVAAAAIDSSVLVWDVRTRAEPVVLSGHLGKLSALAYNPDGTQLASVGNDGMIQLWDTTGAAPPIVLHGQQGVAGSATFSPDGRRLITTGTNGTTTIWKTRGESEPLVLDGFRASLHGTIPLPDDRYATAHGDGTVRIWRCGACGPITTVLADANDHVTRGLTEQERRTFLSIDGD